MLLWIAQAVSQTAQNAIWFALMVLIEESTHSTAQIGLAMVVYIAPSIVFTVPAGVLVDRIDKRAMLVLTNVLRAVIVLGYVVFSGSLVAVYTVTFVFSVVSQFFMPAEAAMIPSLVGRRKLLTANSLFNLTFTLSQLTGIVLLAPVAIKFFGVHALFVAIAVLFGICTILVYPLPRSAGNRLEEAAKDGMMAWDRFKVDLKDTWDFVISDKTASTSMVMLTIGSMLSLVTAMLAPRYMVTIVGIRADDTVYVLAPAGIGMAVGTVVIGRITKWVTKELLTVVGMVGVSIGLLVLAVVGPIWSFIYNQVLAILVSPDKLPTVVSLVSMVMLVAGVMGLALSFVIISSQTLLQEQAPVESRGRVFAVQIMLGNVASILPLVFVGGLADMMGVGKVLIILGFCMVLLAHQTYLAYRSRLWSS